jgi:large subunit ribosomal protein L10e
MALRKSSAYTKRYARPFTRKSKKRSKSYIKTVPNSKIVKFKMGEVKVFEKEGYPIVINVISRGRAQIRDNSIEAVRQHFNRFLLLNIGKDFYFEVKIYPHHILRENKMLTGAGADRMQTGMSQSFGKSMGRAALVKPNQILFIIGVRTPKQETEARKIIHSIKARLPCSVRTQTIKR